jgi:hypothetical protein
MNANPSDAPSSQQVTQPKSSSVSSRTRLVILLGFLILLSGSLVYDGYVAPPLVDAANEKLTEGVQRHQSLALPSGAVKEAKEAEGADTTATALGGALYGEDIHQILGMTPTYTTTKEDYTIEYYRWWGWIPRNRNFIAVLYVGDPAKRRYATHYLNEVPESPASMESTAKSDEPIRELKFDTRNASKTGVPPAGPEGTRLVGPPDALLSGPPGLAAAPGVYTPGMPEPYPITIDGGAKEKVGGTEAHKPVPKPGGKAQTQKAVEPTK